MIMVSLLIDRIDEKAGEHTVIRELIKHMLTQKIGFWNDTDHDIILSKRSNRVRTVCVDQENLVLLQSDRMSVNNLWAAPGIDIVDFNVGMDMLRNCAETGILLD